MGNKTVPLEKAVPIVDKIAAFGKGEMPQGNIILGDPLNIVSGYYVIK